MRPAEVIQRFALAAPPGPEELVPPPRFQRLSLASFEIDPEVPGQAEAVARIRDFVWLGRQWWRRWLARDLPGLYLDGPFGVGKTHLLAACFCEADGERRYLSFSDALSLLTARGLDDTVELLAADLLCLDEFDLDDPAQVRLADQLLERLIERGTRIIATSNAVVGDWGSGTLPSEQFRAQLTRIGAAFAVVHVPGRDRRRLLVAEGEDPPQWAASLPEAPASWLACSQAQLDELLQQLPLIALRRLAAALPGLQLSGVAPFHDQLAALRFVHLVDRLYDWRVPLRAVARCRLAELFPSPPLRSAFRRKHRRCQSRLSELCSFYG
ncbi:MAG: AFG1/ZapE family ATPase [Planctomycetota bacterium]|nr:AFG1/ZapE family ATPase [Planctomycetota bacterium]MDW8373863.1 AFG1/ZapE family ATPase [Planctomycetota bacterium]